MNTDTDPTSTVPLLVVRPGRHGLLHHQLDRCEPPSAGFVIAVAHADELIAILRKQFFVPFWRGRKVTWARMVYASLTSETPSRLTTPSRVHEG